MTRRTCSRLAVALLVAFVATSCSKASPGTSPSPSAGSHDVAAVTATVNRYFGSAIPSSDWAEVARTSTGELQVAGQVACRARYRPVCRSRRTRHPDAPRDLDQRDRSARRVQRDAYDRRPTRHLRRSGEAHQAERTVERRRLHARREERRRLGLHARQWRGPSGRDRRQRRGGSTRSGPCGRLGTDPQHHRGGVRVGSSHRDRQRERHAAGPRCLVRVVHGHVGGVRTDAGGFGLRRLRHRQRDTSAVDDIVHAVGGATNTDTHQRIDLSVPVHL